MNELLSYVADPDPYTLPPLIKDLQQTRHMFTVHIAPGSRRRNTKFILDHAADVMPPALPSIPTAVQGPCPSTTKTQHTPEHGASEIPTLEITPPEPETDDPDEKKTYKSEGVSKTI